MIYIILILITIYIVFINDSIFKYFLKKESQNVYNKNKEIYVYLKKIQETINNFIFYKIKLINASKEVMNKFEQKKLLKQNQINALYIDANLIVFLFDLIQISQYNVYEYYLLVKGTNNILQIKNEIDNYYNINKNYPENIYNLLQTCIQLKKNCMNNLHNFIYKLPKNNKIYKYHENLLKTYNDLISDHINKIYNYNKDFIKINGINTNTRFMNDYSLQDFDIYSNHNIIPMKNTKKLINLY